MTNLPTLEITIPLDDPEFLAGFFFALVVLVGGAVAAYRRGKWRGEPLGIGGYLVAGAAAAGLWQQGGITSMIAPNHVALPPGLVVGLLVLGAGHLIAPRLRFAPRVVDALVLMLGAWIVASWAGLVQIFWIRLLVVVAVVFGGALVADFDRRWARSGLSLVLLPVSAVGVFYTVPDPDEAMVLLGASLPIALLGWPLPIASLGRAGSFVVTGLFTWTVVAAGYGRHSSIVGGIACLGLLVVEPLARLLTGRREYGRATRLPPWQVVIVAVAHLGLVYVASRVAGLRTSVAAAVVISIGVLAFATGALAWLMPKTGTDEASSTRGQP